MSAELSTFGEMVDVLDALPVILRNARRARRVSVRESGRQMDLSFSTVSRVENGEECSTTSLRSILVWLDATETPDGAA